MYIITAIYIAIIAYLNRVREIIIYPSWFDQSNISKIKNKKIYRWFESLDIHEKRYINILGFVIPLHPIFWDGEHFTKNLSALLTLWYAAIWFTQHITPWWLMLVDQLCLVFIGGLIWWGIQTVSLKVHNVRDD